MKTTELPAASETAPDCTCGHPWWDHRDWGTKACVHCSCPIYHKEVLAELRKPEPDSEVNVKKNQVNEEQNLAVPTTETGNIKLKADFTATASDPIAFTPGPWELELVPTSIGSCFKIGTFPAFGSRPVTHACVYADSLSGKDFDLIPTGRELRANARLIAAAPAMFAALKQLLTETRFYEPGAKEYGDQIKAAYAALSLATKGVK